MDKFLSISILILLTVLLNMRLKRLLDKSLAKKKNNFEQARAEFIRLLDENQKLKTGNFDLERLANETTALYDITKDICKFLDEDNLFNCFCEHIGEYVRVGDCKFLKSDADLALYNDSTVFPLRMYKNNIGYLAVTGLKEKDKDKFHIVAQQFLLGIKRAILYKKVQEMAVSDSLTGAYSRRYCLERFGEEIERSKKHHYCLSFIMADIDHFKSHNDRYGHLVGDAILKEVAGTIKENIRQIDLLGRYGGEEFSIILVETDKENAKFAAERIRQAIGERLVKSYDEEVKVTISIGISSFPDDAKDGQGLIEKADSALYKAKQAGRNRVLAFGE